MCKVQLSVITDDAKDSRSNISRHTVDNTALSSCPVSPTAWTREQMQRNETWNQSRHPVCGQNTHMLMWTPPCAACQGRGYVAVVLLLEQLNKCLVTWIERNHLWLTRSSFPATFQDTWMDTWVIVWYYPCTHLKLKWPRQISHNCITVG